MTEWICKRGDCQKSPFRKPSSYHPTLLRFLVRYSVFNVDVMQVPLQEHIDKCLGAVHFISREDANSVLPEIRDVEEENQLAPLRTDETEFGEREAEFSRQTMSPHSEVVENGDLLQRFNNRIMELEKIIADLQAQVTRFNSRVVELEKILADLQAQRNTASLSVGPPITCEDDYRVSPEVFDWLAYFECKFTFYSFVCLK